MPEIYALVNRAWSVTPINGPENFQEIERRARKEHVASIGGGMNLLEESDANVRRVRVRR